jgi:antirestriction protein ArdC
MAQQAGYRTPRYLTFRQAAELGGHVRKGEHGTKVYSVKQLQAKDADDKDKTPIIPMLREYTVFNVDQCEGLPARFMTAGTVKVRNLDERDPTIDEFLACSGASIREGFGEAYYRPVIITSACQASPRSRASRISTVLPSMNLATGPATSRGLTVI